MADLYETLGVARDATTDAIKKAFRRRARETHPDAGGEPEKFHAVDLAHRVLTNDERRAQYDATGRIDETVDNLEANALSIISGLVDRFLDDKEAKFRDIPAEMRKSLTSDIATARKNKEEGQHYVVRTKNLRTKFKGGRGAELVDGMIERQIRQAENALRSLDNQIDIRERALLLLDDVTFEVEARPEFDYEADLERAREAMQRQADMARSGLFRWP